MKTPTNPIQQKMKKAYRYMLTDQKVSVVDTYDNVRKQSSITALYSDNTVTLCDTVQSDYPIEKIRFINPKKNKVK